MNNPIIIAVDAMGGDNSPDKVIEGISLHQITAKNVNYKIFGNKNLINPLIVKYKISKSNFDLIHTDKKLAIDLVSEYRKLVLLNFVDELLPTDAVVEALINSSSDKPKKAREIVRELDKSSNHLAYRALAWLVKLGIYKFK